MSKKKPIRIKVHDLYEVYPEGVFESKVVRSGNGAVIKFYKRYLGNKVIVIVKDKIIEEQDEKIDSDSAKLYSSDEDININEN